MRIFQRTYLGKRGGQRRVATWTIEFRDHRGIVRRIAGFRDKAATQQLGAKLKRLADLRAAGERPDADLVRLLENLPDRIRKKLTEWALLDPAAAAATLPLDVQVDEYRDYLAAKGNTTEHVCLTVSRIRYVLAGIGAATVYDLDPNRVARYLAERRAAGLSTASSNHYLQAIKGFSRWLVRSRRLPADPLASLQPLNAKIDRRHPRRALSEEEARRLLEATRAGTPRGGMTGEQRYWLYRLALETGLRANELRHLTAGDFDLTSEPPVVTVQAAYSKNRRTDTLPLRPATAKGLRIFLAGKRPAVPAFPMPTDVARILRADLEAAGIPYRTDAGVADFHSLRHTFITNLARAGVPPKVTQDLARHSTITLTMDRYSHVHLPDRMAALSRLPDLEAPQRQAACAAAEQPAPEGPPPALGAPLSVPAVFRSPQKASIDTGDARRSRKHEMPKTAAKPAPGRKIRHRRAKDVSQARTEFEPANSGEVVRRRRERREMW